MQEIGQLAVAATLADIRQQQASVVMRLGGLTPLRLAAIAVMGISVASCAVPGAVISTVASCVFIVCMPLLFGVSARVGAVPRED